MTVCIASICRWNYSTLDNPDLGYAALILTDRMITAGDVQYEPQQQKVAHITPHALLMIAGDYSLHSQALKRTMDHFRSDPNASPESIAVFYGRQIQAIKLKQSEDIFLAPLGLNSDSFLAQQKDMAPHFVSLLTDQLQGYRGEDVEALVVGHHNNIVSIYGVDTKGIIANFDDVGFAAIGVRAWHAKSRLMQVGYTSTIGFAPALCFAYAAKKASEMAPGVGPNTDLHLVFINSIQRLRDDVANKLHALYLEYRPKSDALGIEYINRMQEFISKPTLQVADESPKGLPGGDAQISERSSPPAAETARKNETGAA